MVDRGTGPWPKTNNESTVKSWFISRVDDGVEAEELDSIVRISLEHVSCKSKGERIMDGFKYPESAIDRLAVIADGLKQKEPLQYLLGNTFFDGLEILVDERVLIPRPETEELVMMVASRLGVDFHGDVLDIGTGSGCIAIALKKRMPSAGLFGVDVSKDALVLAQKNSEHNSVHVDFKVCDVLNNIPYEGRNFDVVVSNPPYIPQAESSNLEGRVMNEPALALFVDDSDPLIFYSRIIDLCLSGMLAQGGWIAFECHSSFAEEVLDLFRVSSGAWTSIILEHDLQGLSRHVFARLELS